MAQKLREMHPELIKAELRQKFGSLKMVGEMLRRSPKTISVAIRHPDSFATQERIAALLGRPAPAIWPDRYNPDGSRKKGLYRKRHENAASGRSS